MKKVFRQILSGKLTNLKSFNKNFSPRTEQVRKKKEAAFREVGKRYSKAITRLSDT